MFPSRTYKANPAGLVPARRPGTPWHVVAAQVNLGQCPEVAFADGTAGEVRLRRFLEGQTGAGTVFEELRDPDAFVQACAELGAVTWPNGGDLAPDAMYDAIRQHRQWTEDS